MSLFGRLGLNGTIPSHLLRLYIHLILSCSMGNFAAIMATVCSSWVQINCFTSCRSLLLPEGDESKRYIKEANTMLSRTLIFTLVTLSWQHFWVQDNVSWVHIILYIVFMPLSVKHHHQIERGPSLAWTQVCSTVGPDRSLWWIIFVGAATFKPYGGVFPDAMVHPDCKGAWDMHEWLASPKGNHPDLEYNPILCKFAWEILCGYWSTLGADWIGYRTVIAWGLPDHPIYVLPINIFQGCFKSYI